MSGDSLVAQPSVFGTQGVPDPMNKPGGIYEGCEWVDLAGNFYFYGGLDYNSATQADLWRFDPSTNEWTWLNGPGGTGGYPVYGTRGIASPTNQPGDRGYGMLSWVDNGGNLWMYGGYSNTSFTFLADFWKYNISTNLWTWMGGDTLSNSTGYHGVMGMPSPLNHPPPSSENACSWVEGDDLWFYGGSSQGGPSIGDMWRYNISSDMWTWMKGDTTIGAAPVYGTLGVSAPANFPGARTCYSRWKDLNGDLWIFGGSTSAGYNNDLWRYVIATNEWTWMHGANVPYDGGFYGTKCGASTILDCPSARFESRVTWTDACGTFWLFGGFGGALQNDLWRYDINTDLWTWVSGNSVAGATSIYGTKGVSSPTNMPGGKAGAHAFKDLNGNLWLFGGSDAGGNMSNDLWRYVPDPACGACTTVPAPIALFSAPNHICPGTCTNFTNNSTGATSYLWTFAGANPTSSVDQNPSNICYNTPGNYSVTLIASNGNSSDTLTLNNFITVYAYPSPQGILQNGDTLFANIGSAGYQWYLNGSIITGATNYFYVASISGNYNIVATDTNGCEVEAAIFDVVASIQSNCDERILTIHVFPNPVDNLLNIKFSSSIHLFEISITNSLGISVMRLNPVIDKEGLVIDVDNFPSGAYWLEVESKDFVSRIPFIKL